jgi:hypothetical protein
VCSNRWNEQELPNQRMSKCQCLLKRVMFVLPLQQVCCVVLMHVNITSSFSSQGSTNYFKKQIFWGAFCTPFYSTSDLLVGSEVTIVHTCPAAQTGQLSGPILPIHRPHMQEKSKQKCA